MGEIAEALINGDDCQICGVPFDDEGDGFPRTCAGCSDDDDDDLASDYRAMKEEKKRRHAEWYATNMQLLEKSGLKYRSVSGGQTLLFREPNKPKIDFYPSTGRWRVAGQRAVSGGAKKFIDWYLNQ